MAKNTTVRCLGFLSELLLSLISFNTPAIVSSTPALPRVPFGHHTVIAALHTLALASSCTSAADMEVSHESHV